MMLIPQIWRENTTEAKNPPFENLFCRGGFGAGWFGKLLDLPIGMKC